MPGWDGKARRMPPNTPGLRKDITRDTVGAQAHAFLSRLKIKRKKSPLLSLTLFPRNFPFLSEFVGDDSYGEWVLVTHFGLSEAGEHFWKEPRKTLRTKSGFSYIRFFLECMYYTDCHTRATIGRFLLWELWRYCLHRDHQTVPKTRKDENRPRPEETGELWQLNAPWSWNWVLGQKEELPGSILFLKV